MVGGEKKRRRSKFWNYIK